MDARLETQLARSLSSVSPDEWDALAGQDDPFIEHGFLLALERSGSVGEDTGWDPCHVLVRREGRLVGAMPLYIKGHSYGEYIFDWAWANAAMRAGIDYYPKVLSAVPFTPATGRRMLVEGGATRGPVVDALMVGGRAAVEMVEASSLHVLFLTAEESEALADEHALMPRTTYQYHWVNQGWETFDDYLAAFRASARRQVRRERRIARESGLELITVEGPDMTDAQWRGLLDFYRSTTARKYAYRYLTPAFFEEIRRSFAHRVVASFAMRGSQPIAGSLCFEKGGHLYGRYWGALEHHECVHFELCYYQLLERCIARGHQRFEAGAQGQHKVKRGLMPSATHSVHWIEHPGLRRAIAEFLPSEREAMREEMALLARHGPFKRQPTPPRNEPPESASTQ